MGPLIVKEPPPLPKPRKVPEQVPQEVPEPKPSRIPEVGQMKLVEPKTRRMLSHKRAVQAVTALAITVGVLLLAVIVLVVFRIRTNTKGKPRYVNIYLPTMHDFLPLHISMFTTPPCMFLTVHIPILT